MTSIHQTPMQQAYHQPKTIEEAQALLGESSNAVLVAGGTDLFVQRRARGFQGHVTQGPIISLRGIPELRGIEERDDVMIMSCEPLTGIMEHETIRRDYPALVQSIEVLGSHQIRNVATLGGNLCNASPAADTAPPLIVYGARVKAFSMSRGDADKCRVMEITDFFTGPGRTCLEPHEIVRGIVLDPPNPNLRSAFLRLGRVKMDLAIVSLAVAFEWDGKQASHVCVAAGAVAPVPLRLTETEGLLEGSGLDAATLELASAKAAAEISPIDDQRASAEYRRDLIAVFLRRAIRAALEPTANASGKGKEESKEQG